MNLLMSVLMLSSHFAAAAQLLAPQLPTQLPAPQLPREGWASWAIQTVERAPNYCCMEWRNQKAKSAICDLDKIAQGFSDEGKRAPSNQAMVYAKLVQGKITDLRSYALHCPVRSATPIQPLVVSNAQSLLWVSASVLASGSGLEHRLAAIALHHGEQAQAELERIALDNGSRAAQKSAIFWLGQLRAEPGAKYLRSLLGTVGRDSIREHIVFSLSQNSSQNKFSYLRQIAPDNSSSRIRASAWFWQAQIAAPTLEVDALQTLNPEIPLADAPSLVF